MLTMRLRRVLRLSPASQLRLRRSTARALTASSIPLFVISPMLTNGEEPKPDDGAIGCESRRSFDVLLK
jgi:hypothetical protein